MRSLLRTCAGFSPVLRFNLITVPHRGIIGVLYRKDLDKNNFAVNSKDCVGVAHGNSFSWPLQSFACKHTFNREKGKKTSDDEAEEDENWKTKDVDPSLLTDVNGKDTKLIKAKVNSLRMDSLLKAGLGISRNKTEVAFYESRIRVNGAKVLKKSKQMHEGDEIDIIRGHNSMNPEFLDVSRVVVVAIEDSHEDYIPIILKSYKLLTIENYGDSYKRTSSE